MTDSEVLRVARRGREYWNNWRSRHQNDPVDFSDVDFTLPNNKGIQFKDFDLGKAVCFNGATFGDGVTFEAASIGDKAQFKGATFKGTAQFARTAFGASVNFDDANFEGVADFTKASFGVGASFTRVTFSDELLFRRATLGGASSFVGAILKTRGQFDDVYFGPGAMFSGAVFGDGTSFKGARLDNIASFEGAIFAGLASFESGNVGEEFFAVDFSRAFFGGQVSFADRAFRGAVNFSSATFCEPPDFRATTNRENLDWTGIQFDFGKGLKIGPISLSSWTTRSDTVTRLRRLRGIANQIHAVDAERDLFILERKAERGFLWKQWWQSRWRAKLTGLWRPLQPTILMWLYSVLSDCGRSPVRPLAAFFAWNVGIYWIYELLTGRPLSAWADAAVRDLTIASAVPFSATARPTLLSALESLFTDVNSGLTKIPWEVQLVSAVQAVMNLVLLFLLGLALRNHFKVK